MVCPFEVEGCPASLYCAPVRFLISPLFVKTAGFHISCGREYAPKFALRSYFYLLPSVGAARASETFLSLFGQGNDKPQVSVRNTCVPSVQLQKHFRRGLTTAAHMHVVRRSETTSDAGGVQRSCVNSVFSLSGKQYTPCHAPTWFLA